MSTFEQYDISSSFSSIVVVCHSCFRELAPRNCIFDPIELRYTRMTVVWWSLRLCPSLVAWIYIGRFLGKSFFCILVFGSKQNKELPYIHTISFLPQFEDFHGWIPVKSLFLPKKEDFLPEFFWDTKNYFYLVWRANISNDPNSVLLLRLPRFRASPSPQTALETFIPRPFPPRHILASFDQHRRHWPNLVSIRCNPPLLKEFWKLTESYHTCVTGLL